MRRCRACGSLFPSRFPDPASIGLAYSSYYTAPEKRGLVSRLKRALLDEMQGDVATRQVPRIAGRVLDFGCGSGEWLAKLHASNPHLNLSGTDITRPGEGPLSFQWIEPSELASHKSGFDWITMSHVIEHLPDPRETLQTLAACLAPGGAIWIATPNADGYLFASLRGRARDADFPRHRQIFSAGSLAQILEDCGLDTSFQMAPRINSLLNLQTGLAARSRMPQDIDQPVNAGAAIRDTLAHILSRPSSRRKDTPEHIVIARKR